MRPRVKRFESDFRNTINVEEEYFYVGIIFFPRGRMRFAREKRSKNYSFLSLCGQEQEGSSKNISAFGVRKEAICIQCTELRVPD